MKRSTTALGLSVALFVAFCGPWGLWGCAGGGAGSGGGASASDPGLVAADREANPIGRERAIREGWAQVAGGQGDRAAWRETVKRIAWSTSNPARTRLVALETLLADDETDTRTMVALMLPREPAWPVIEWIGDTAAARNWVDLTPALIRSWSRPVVDPKDPDRPERRALVAMHGEENLSRVVFSVFAQPAGEGLLEERRRTDAWALLCRIDPDLSDTRGLLEVLAPSDDALIGALRTSASELRAVPRTAEQLEWLADMRQPAHGAFWEQASRAVAQLDAEQLRGFELRHVAGVRWASENRPQWLLSSRESLLSELSQRLAGRRVYQRQSGFSDGLAPDERLVSNAARMVWGDILLVLIADEAITTSPSVRAALFEQADADRRDTSTEYGGVLDWRNGAFVAVSHPPRPAQRMGDNRFVASPEMMKDGATALFHYHFHASRASMRDYSGPGQGDDEYADRLGRSCLVFTSLSADSLNADYYQPRSASGVVVVDLGEIRRP